MKDGERKQLKTEALFLVLKILAFAMLLAIAFTLIIGIARCSDDSMSPSCKDGDLAVYYRLQGAYLPRDVVVVEKGDKTQVRRIVAVSGDTVDITADGLVIDGYLQQEDDIYEETLPYRGGARFPIRVGEGEYFVLGDKRSNAEDSRIYGVVNQKDIKGIVITLIRRRNL